jgi:anaerobic magnesium-protoporphyrin IX monomethyl ester cyclase
MKILLINPPRVMGYPVVREERFEHKDMGSVYPPQSLLQTAAILEKEKCAVSLLDANGFDLKLSDISKKIKEFQPDIVLIRLGFDTQKEDLKVAGLAKKLGVLTIVRNHIISRTPKIKQEILKKYTAIDIFLNQEPEAVMPQLVKTIKNKGNLSKVPGITYRSGKKLITNKDASIMYDLNKLPFPAYHLLPGMDVYFSGTYGPPFSTILCSRGCPFNCAFCAYCGMPYRTRSPKSIANELEKLSKEVNVNEFCLFDDVATLSPERMIEICKEIISRKIPIRWSAGLRAPTVTYEMLKWMKKAGCDEIAIGMENGTDEILTAMDKRVTVKDIKKASEAAHKAGIKLYAMFIIGLPGETKQSVEATIRLAKEIKPFYTQFMFATPFPDTRIYNYYKKNKFLLSEDWSKYFPLNKEPIVRTKELTKKDLIDLKNKAYRETLFDFKYLVGQIKWNDWKWNIRGIKQIGNRMLAALSFKPLR